MYRKTPLVSIVVPTYNSIYFIEHCIDSVFTTNYPNYEVIIIDDCSTDGTVEKIKAEYGYLPKLRIYRNKKRKLAAYSRNIGFRRAKGDFVALLDHDAEVDKNWIRKMMELILTDLSIGIVQSKVFDINKRKILQFVGAKIIPQLGWVEGIGLGLKDDSRFHNPEGVVAGATGVLYRKKAFEKIGGFDEKLKINIDDVDLNWRMWLAGYKTKIAPCAITYHWLKKSQTRDKWLGRLSWEFHYSKMIRVFIKNYSTKNLAKNLPILIIVYLIRGFFNLFFRLNPAPLTGLLLGLLWNTLNMPDSLRERMIIQNKIREVDDSILSKIIFTDNNLLKSFLNIWLPTVKVGSMLATSEISRNV